MDFENKYQEECGVIGFWNNDNYDAADLIFMGMYGIQHRGQQSAGIAINDSKKIICQKELGLITEVFDDIMIRHLRGGSSGVGHCGYKSGTENLRENALPLVMRYTKGQMALSYNGCLLNAEKLRLELEETGAMFQTTSDAEIIAILLSKERLSHNNLESAMEQVMKKLEGSYSLLVLTPHKLIAVRDKNGIKPLCMGKIKNSYIFASESSAIDTVGGTMIRDIIPGEIVSIDAGGEKSIITKTDCASAMCIFEFVYTARTDSYIDGASVYSARFEAGRALAKEAPVEADLVVGIPDSGIAAAVGYAYESGIRYAEGLTKNRYIGRTFILPSQELREAAIGLKLNALRSQIEGKKIVLIDDSIVRGTTMKTIVTMIRNIGKAKEVHLRISSPATKFPCHYGIDTRNKEDLIARKVNNEELKILLGADSVEFISIESLMQTPVNAKCGFCAACFNGEYPISIE